MIISTDILLVAIEVSFKINTTQHMKRFISSFRYAVNGVWAALRGQSNIKIQLVVGATVVMLGFYFSITPVEWGLLLLSIGLVLSLELMNTAIENLVDLVTPERNLLAGKVKDISAGAVLITSVAAAGVGIIVFGKYIFALI